MILLDPIANKYDAWALDEQWLKSDHDHLLTFGKENEINGTTELRCDIEGSELPVTGDL